MIKNVTQKTKNKSLTLAICIAGILTILSNVSADTNHFSTQWTGNPFNRMVFWIIGHSGQLNIGDEIAVFDGDNCVGVGKINQTISPDNPLTIICSNDDNKEDNIVNGFFEKNPIIFRVWDSKKQKELENVSVTYFNISDGSQLSPPLFTTNSDVAVELFGDSDIPGDIDHSGKVDLRDVLFLLQIVTGFNADLMPLTINEELNFNQ
jgi:hypothetical protein